jgi:hypothetical protein
VPVFTRDEERVCRTTVRNSVKDVIHPIVIVPLDFIILKVLFFSLQQQAQVKPFLNLAIEIENDYIVTLEDVRIDFSIDVLKFVD